MANPQNKTSISTDQSLKNWIEETRQELKQQREALRKEARMAFIVAIVAFAVGLLLIFASIIVNYISSLPTSIATATFGLIVGVACSIAFKLYKEVNNRLFRVSDEMNSLDKNNIAMQYISKIADGRIKDRAIQDLSRSIYAKV